MVGRPKKARKPRRVHKWKGRKPRVKDENRKRAKPKGPFACYLLLSVNPEYPKTTYTGASGNSTTKRFAEHQKGKCKRSRNHGPWEQVCEVTGFQDWVQTLQFEWAWHDECGGCTRWSRGVDATIKAMYRAMNRKRWTSAAPLASEVPLQIKWHGKYQRYQEQKRE